ncbi:PREDICTED: calcium channel flower homolog [Branchiostoma belcheri]|uniref:Calcium channel flower homolog n=1 Tax=Branchiostoma belcheri TaxID=7741 RepID=A0A6P5ANB2_BRABE|nr:PREDICTED: calcium channel flower homolog [Branchiostoma belcheri]
MNQGKDAGKDEVAWWFKILGRCVGAIAALVCMGMGIWACVSLHPTCIVAGVIMVCLGFLTMVLEAPICCQFFDGLDRLAAWIGNLKYIYKAILYCVLSIFPMMLCFEMSTVFGSGLVFVTGAIYGVMALGKKGGQARRPEDVEMNQRLTETEEPVATTPPEGT